MYDFKDLYTYNAANTWSLEGPKFAVETLGPWSPDADKLFGQIKKKKSKLLITWLAHFSLNE